MKKFEFDLLNENGTNDKAYIVVIYDWNGNTLDDFGMNVVASIPFFSKEKADEYVSDFLKHIPSYEAIIIPY